MTVKWNGAKIKAAAREAIANGLTEAAFEAEDIARRSMQNGRYNPVVGVALTTRGDLVTRRGEPSAPGQYPAVQTSSLRNSLTTRSATSSSLSAAFGVFGGKTGVAKFVRGQGTAGYPLYLETGTARMAPRPWAKRTIDENRPRLQGVFVKAARNEFRRASR